MGDIKKFFKKYLFELIGAVIFAVVSVALVFINMPAAIIAFSALIVYLAVWFILSRVGVNKENADRDGSGFSQMITRLVEKIDAPVMIVNENNKIVWCNDEFHDLKEVSSKHISAGAGKLFGGSVSYSGLLGAYEEFVDYISVDTEDSSYAVKVFPLEFRRQKLFGTVWYSRDTENKLRTRLNDEKVLVAYIVIDNTNEVTQEIQDNRRFGSAVVNKLLTDWAAQYNAILIEYERDKYVMQFENLYLSNMIADKFDILDKVVEASLDESSVPITISIGVSGCDGTLSEKKESAQSALRSALQRGGAVAVVRTENGEDTYGGRTKAVQRQTKIRSRLCKDLLCTQLPLCSNVIIMGHTRPDYDSIASNIGISKLVQAYEKKYCIVADRNDKNISKIIDTIADFPEYDAVFVDAVYAQELLTPDTLVIITDASNPELFAARGVYDNASKVVVIDHHAIKESLGEQVLQPSNIDPTASSASELVCEMLELSLKPGTLRPEEAQVLLAGILLDTQFFARDTGTRTYSACSFLKNAGAETGKAKSYFKSDYNQFRAITKIEQNMEIYRDSFIISTYTDSIENENKVTASKAADRLVEIDGVSASFVLYSLDNGINLSARSDGSVNVINIAKTLGGGGHFQSAGAIIKNSNGDVVFDIEEAVLVLKAAIDEYVGVDMKEGK